MPVEKREAAWIKKHGEKKSVKDWLVANPPPAEFQGTPQQWAFLEMEEEPIDDPLEPDFEEFPEGKPVTRREHDELRLQVARVAKGFNRAIKKRREVPPPAPPPSPGPEVIPPAPVKRTGLAAILAPLERR